MAKNLGESMRIFRKEMRTMSEEKAADKKAKPNDADVTGDDHKTTS
jgi:Sec-independent protein translocase protein TatA